ncbi:MAG TPA: M36 family metallopeptidase [Pyrinomonadaceae bacterium]|jgi:hypothetical protein
MSINFIPNDPLALAASPMRTQNARKNRPAGRAGFTFVNAPKEGLYNPGTPEFLFWQAREAALAALEVWEALNGNLKEWARSTPDRKKLVLKQNAGQDLNAFYDGNSLSFFEFTAGGKTTFSGASTDVVAHEAGHALLDTIRPDLWSSNLTEPNAFHEAFGDCVALLTCLFDQETRVALLKASPDLGKANFVEALAEELSDMVRIAIGKNHSAAAPRHSLNNFKWQLPTTLPTNGPPDVLISEIHSFGRVFSGCFYDVIRNIFNAYPNKTEATLLTAAQTAGKLLIAGASAAPQTPRFFQAVGRAMSAADQSINSGANREAIRAAFARHNIALGTNAMLAPRAALAGSAPKFAAATKSATAKVTLSAATRNDLRNRIGADANSKLTVSASSIGGEPLVEAVHHREVSLSDVSDKLKGVVAFAAEPVLVGGVSGRAAIMSALPESFTTTDEVHAFVQSLLKNDQIAFEDEKRKPASRKTGFAAATNLPKAPPPTHVIRSRSGKKILERVRFVCRCGCR